MTNIRDYEAVTESLQHYINGAMSGKGCEMKPTFHNDATIFGFVGAYLYAGPIQGLYDWNEANGLAKVLVFHIVSIDIVETVASVV
jgi:hypothetical protein